VNLRPLSGLHCTAANAAVMPPAPRQRRERLPLSNPRRVSLSKRDDFTHLRKNPAQENGYAAIEKILIALRYISIGIPSSAYERLITPLSGMMHAPAPFVRH